MEHVLYADILFFINFSMDFITLYLTSRLTSGPPAGIRAALSAVIGGIYGTVAVALGIDGIAGVITTGAVSVVMVLVAFGCGGVAVILRRAAVFWGGAALLGGVMTAICSLGESIGAPGSSSGGTALLFGGSMICMLIIRIITRFRKRKVVRVTVNEHRHSSTFEALVDSGNLVTDPISGRAVIIVDRSALWEGIADIGTAAESIPENFRSKLRMIPVKGFGGDGLLTGFVPDRITVSDGGRDKICSAVIAVTDKGGTFFGGYPANVPMSLI